MILPHLCKQSYDLHKKMIDTKRDFAGAKVCYREHVLSHLRPYSKTCGGPKTFTSTTIFKKCGGKTTSGGQERYILKTQ